ncbi:MAG: ABC transporter ATP-binding protein [Candidatus Delongbacteria bacterium]
MWWDRDNETEAQAGALPTWGMLRRVHPYVRPHLPRFGLALLLALAGVGLMLLQPVIFKRIVDVDYPAKDMGGLLTSVGVYTALLALGTLFSGLATVLLGRGGVEVVNVIKRDLFAKALALGLPWLESKPVGTLVSRIESDSQRLVNLTSTMAVRILSATVMIFGSVLVVSRVDHRLFLICAAVLPVMVGGTWFIFGRMRARFREERRQYAKITGEVAELAPAARLIQALGVEAWAEERLAGHNRGYKRFVVRLNLLEYSLWGGMGLMQILMTCLALWLGSAWIADGSMSAGTLVMFAQYAGMIYWPIIELSEQLAEIQRAGGAADRIFTMLDTPPTVPAPADPKPLPARAGRAGRLEFQSVSFEYEAGKPVLTDFNLVVEPGETVALVGPTGGGKSTILNLVTRLRDVSAGRILLDGTDIREFDPREYRRLFGLVLQDLYLFPASVEDNLRAFRPEVPAERVREAARVAGIEEEILRRPQGYAAVLAERGADLSYGQRQLLALARALAVDPPILVLDEATSSVDPRTERHIQRTLELLTRGRTTLVVAHRLSTVRHADRILVVRGGTVAEQGRHAELLALDGLYAELLRTQQAHHGAAAILPGPDEGETEAAA